MLAADVLLDVVQGCTLCSFCSCVMDGIVPQRKISLKVSIHVPLIYDCIDIIAYVQQVVCCSFAGMATSKGERCPEKVHSPYLFFSPKHLAKMTFSWHMIKSSVTCMCMCVCVILYHLCRMADRCVFFLFWHKFCKAE